MRLRYGTILAAVAFAASQCAALADLGMGRNDEWRSVCVDRVRLNGPLLYALDTRRIKGFEKAHPLDAATVVMLDSAQLEFKADADGGRSAFCGTAIATRCTTVDYARWIGQDDPEIMLTEFADEDDTLAYFRTPIPDSPLLVDDELFGK